MKRVIILLALLVAVLLSACGGNGALEEFTRVSNEGGPVYNDFFLQVYFREGIYTVTIQENDVVVKGAQYSEDRNAVQTSGLKLIRAEDISRYLGKSLVEAELTLGRHHVDIGSGMYMPAYLTCDGYLIVFSVDMDDRQIIHVGKMDLFTGESVEWYFLDEGS